MTNPVKRIAGKLVFSVANRLMSIRMQSNSFVLYVPKSSETDLPQAVIQLVKNDSRSQKYTINLSYMTSEELDLFEEFMKIAIGIARPLSKALDSYVEENRETLSADFNSRVYRPVSTVVLGQGALDEYNSSLFDGHSDVLRRAGFRFRDDRLVPPSGSRVANSETKGAGSDHPEPTNGVSEGVREVLWPDFNLAGLQTPDAGESNSSSPA